VSAARPAGQAAILPPGSGGNPGLATALADDDRVAVVDIGSNSVRCVVFARAARSLMQLYNDKAMCSIGRGLVTTGRLDPDGVVMARANLKRFAAVIRGMGVTRTICIATAAARDAIDGPDFVNAVIAETGLDVRVISGDEEARLSAVGVVSSISDAHGIVGDLGGGSLELVSLDRGRLGSHDSLPLGPFRLIAEGTPKQLADAIDAQLDRLAWLRDVRGGAFYPVGGAWRAFARLHMDHVNYPLRVIHHYRIPARDATMLASQIARGGGKATRLMRTIPRRRRETLPYAALVMDRLIRRLRPDQVVFSAYGLREGLLYDRLSMAEQARDPLIEACRDMALLGARFLVDGEMLARWIAPLFPNDTPAAARLRLAAAWVGDIAGLDHPDYRGEHAFMRVLRMGGVGIDHPGRAFLALAVLARYEGDFVLPLAGDALKLLPPADAAAARIVGRALRLGYALAPGGAEVLDGVSLSIEGGKLQFTRRIDHPLLQGEMIDSRVAELAESVERAKTVV
jgi:exopolyphosphatase/guanosine-5'-triphosphate,3'-diphosphate pyrophosphatase